MVTSTELANQEITSKRMRHARWQTSTPQMPDADEAMASSQPKSRRVELLSELLATLPADVMQKVSDDVAEYLATQGQAEQFRLLFEEDAPPVMDPARRSGRKATPVQPIQHRRKLIAFGWYGGKFSHLNWLLPQLPPAHHYCEPFGGSAAVLLNRAPSPVETYNDLFGDVANFFRVLRDNTDALVKAIGLTPFSREEFAASLDDARTLSDVERARLFFVRARQVRTGLAQTASLGRWANCKNTSRAGMAGVVSRWLGSVDALPEIAARLLRVQIENRPALETIRLYDSRDTLFYCDPPYPHDSRSDSKAYKYEMTADEHAELAAVLRGVKGKVAVSGYHCESMDRLYAGWRCVEAPEKNCHSVKKPRTEALWMNY